MNEQDTIEQIGDEPNMEQINAELNAAISGASDQIQQMQNDFNTRYCKWSGQSDDGRKWEEVIGAKAFPWDGASDTKIRSADAIVIEQVAMMTEAFASAKIQASATTLESVPMADAVTSLMQWLFRTQLLGEVALEVELAANWRQTYGLAVMAVTWDQQRRLTKRTVTMEELTQQAGAAAEQGDNSKLALLDKLFDPLAREEVVAMMAAQTPLLDKRQIRKLLDELTSDGVTEYPEVVVLKSLPKWEALRPWIDIFFPPNTKTLRTAPWVAWRRWMRESELRDAAKADGWDEDWVDAVIADGKGKAGDLGGLAFEWSNQRNGGFSIGTPDDLKDSIEVIFWHQRGMDEKTGEPTMVQTIFCPAVQDSWAKHGLFPFIHGEMPFIELVRERPEVRMTDSRSVPQIAATWQNEIKTQRDARTDHASIVTMPPLIVPPNKGRTQLEFGPGVQHTERRPGDIRWMTVPAYSQASLEAERSGQADLDGYFGRFSEKVSPVVSQLFAKKLVRDFLKELSQCAMQTLQLCQQYLPPVMVNKVVGANRIPMMLSREDIMGQFALAMSFDVEQLDPELVMKKLNMWQTFILTADTMGLIDRAKYLKYAARLISPEMADELIGDPQAAAQSEVADESVQFAKMVAGVEPEMKQGGQNYQLRLQTLQGFIQANPEVQAMIQGRQVLQQMVENRMKHFQFMIQQNQVNPLIGKVGAAPTLGVQG